MEQHSLDDKSQVPYQYKINKEEKKTRPKTEEKRDTEAKDINLSDLPKGVNIKGNIPANRRAPFEHFKTQTKTNFGEPPGIDYGKVFSKIGEFFRQGAKLAERGALAYRDFIRNPTILSKKETSIKEVKFASDLKKPQSKSLKVATSNVGMDGAYGKLNAYLNGPNNDPENYLNDQFKKLESFQQNLTLKPESHELKIIPFLEELDLFLSEKNTTGVFSDVQKERLTHLVGFLTNLENRQQLKNNSSIFKTFIDGMNDAIFSIYHFSKIHDEWSEQKDGSALNEYLKNKIMELTEERLNQIKDSDVCFLQELVKNSDFTEKMKERKDIALFIPKGELGHTSPSLMINTNRFRLEKFPQDGKRIKNTDYVEAKIQTPHTSKVKPTIQIYDDGSFGSSEQQFKAVIATDTKNNRKMLLCSLHVRGYGIGKNDQMYEGVLDDIYLTRRILEKIALDHGVDGIIIGGDFNSVEERVGDLYSPLELLKEAKFVPIRFEGDTEVSPSGSYQEGYDLSRKIDHLFFKWLSKDGRTINASKGKVASGGKGSLDPLKQTVFDHEAVSAEIEIKKSWLKMLKHRFHHLKT